MSCFFRPAVWISDGVLGVRPIETLGQALAVLQGSEADNASEKRSIALDMIEQCAKGSVTLETARGAFLSFVREAGWLAETVPPEHSASDHPA